MKCYSVCVGVRRRRQVEGDLSWRTTNRQTTEKSAPISQLLCFSSAAGVLQLLPLLHWLCGSGLPLHIAIVFQLAPFKQIKMFTWTILVYKRVDTLQELSGNVQCLMFYQGYCSSVEKRTPSCVFCGSAEEVLLIVCGMETRERFAGQE